MPDLVQSLQGRDLGHLRIVAELWGLDFNAPDARIGLQRLAALLMDKELLSEVVQVLPEGAGRALQELCYHEGRIPWGSFTRRYGAVREMGAARRDRERPYLNQLACATEALWYRGLVARAFFDTPAGPEEFAYVPEDLLALIPRQPEAVGAQSLGRPATPLEKAHLFATTDRILDDACTLLAGLRQGYSLDLMDERLICAQNSPYPLKAEILRDFLIAGGLLSKSGAPRPESIRDFLEASRGQALALLVKGWLHSPIFNELRLVPTLEIEGEWKNDPLQARSAVLDFLSNIPGSLAGQGEEKDRPFWSVSAFLTAIHQSLPDFQRSAGEYDAWFLREKGSGRYLRGFECWDEVDGALLKFMIGGPLFWLGIVDLGLDTAPEAGSVQTITAFRYSTWAQALLNLRTPSGLPEENEQVSVFPDGRMRVPLKASRTARYQIARFSEWEGFAQDSYRYRLTPGSLETARKQGLKPQHLLALLRRVSKVIPPGFIKALERWETYGNEIRAEQVTVLRVSDPEIIQALRSSKAARFLGEMLNPKMVIIRSGTWGKVAAILAEMGYLSDVRVDDE